MGTRQERDQISRLEASAVGVEPTWAGAIACESGGVEHRPRASRLGDWAGCVQAVDGISGSAWSSWGTSPLWRGASATIRLIQNTLIKDESGAVTGFGRLRDWLSFTIGLWLLSRCQK